ncbi:MAG TPA: TlpA disulfide reductase family protein [Candidatus Aquilonibacter sp.]|nr:TlpA disulfide reductase family protein [Candidatus Aquilonibacter sp.]
MKKIMFTVLLGAAFTASAQNFVEEVTPSARTLAKLGTNLVDFSSELANVTAQLKAKFDAGKTNEADLQENLTAINDLIVRHINDGDREQLARLYLLDAHIYADGLKEPARARAIWGQVVRDFPGTLAAKGASLSLARLQAQLAAAPEPNVPEGLEIGQKFPGFNETDLAGKPLSVAAYKGKVTLVDFWATWCPPCRAEVPNVVAIYNQYHPQGFDIIGISLDDDRNALVNFTQTQGMSWAQYFDGLDWNNKLAKQYNIQSIPMDYLLDGHGVIVGKDLRGEALAAAVVKALSDNQ